MYTEYNIDVYSIGIKQSHVNVLNCVQIWMVSWWHSFKIKNKVAVFMEANK